ncbi:MAG: glycosyltransferase family 2 protein [Spirochaetia bacterium]|nr:glycosyltransferase family 2 protein [Spirochaetia bacterium]
MKKVNSAEISVVLPVYKCTETIKELSKKLVLVLSKISKDYEIIFVVDGCPENPWSLINSLADKNKKIKGIKLSKNFGQHHAITAGIDSASGNWVVVMDCDMQEEPADIEILYKKAMEGFDIVLCKRVYRKDSFFKKAGSKMFFLIFNYLTTNKAVSSIGNFGIYSKKVIDCVKLLKEQNRAFWLLVNWVGFNKTTINTIRHKRKKGRSSYNLKKLINLAMSSIIAHSNKPLKFTIFIGLLLSFFSFVAASWVLYQYFVNAYRVLGWTSLMISINFLGGLILGAIGMLGLYIEKIFDQVKNRPLYIIDKKINL